MMFGSRPKQRLQQGIMNNERTKMRGGVGPSSDMTDNMMKMVPKRGVNPKKGLFKKKKRMMDTEIEQ
jgi:hypothetical protein